MTLVKFQPAAFKTHFPEFQNAFQPFATISKPAINVLESPDGFEIEVAAPGLNKEDFELKIEKDLLKITARKPQTDMPEGLKLHRKEFDYTGFERVFRLPESIDANSVKAAYNNGVLQIALLFKPEVKPLTRSIEVA